MNIPFTPAYTCSRCGETSPTPARLGHENVPCDKCTEEIVAAERDAEVQLTPPEWWQAMEADWKANARLMEERGLG